MLPIDFFLCILLWTHRLVINWVVKARGNDSSFHYSTYLEALKFRFAHAHFRRRPWKLPELPKAVTNSRYSSTTSVRESPKLTTKTIA
jgi:hypothetical protein